MERLFSPFSLYDFLGYVLSGGLLLAGTYWAFNGLPSQEPGAAAVLGIVALAYAAGHLVQSLANVWEGWLWSRKAMPSTARMTSTGPGAYSAELRIAITQKAEATAGTRNLEIADQFAVARARLREAGLDGRSELMNSLYGLCRGLATTTGLLVPAFIAAWLVTGDSERLATACASSAAACLLYYRRALRYSDGFADQVWRDFLALSDPAPGHSTRDAS